MNLDSTWLWCFTLINWIFVFIIIYKKDKSKLSHRYYDKITHFLIVLSLVLILVYDVLFILL